MISNTVQKQMQPVKRAATNYAPVKSNQRLRCPVPMMLRPPRPPAPPLLPLLLFSLLLLSPLAAQQPFPGCILSVTPDSIADLTVGSSRQFSLNCTCCQDSVRLGQVFIATVRTSSWHIASVGGLFGAGSSAGSVGGSNVRDLIYPFPARLSVEANNVGRATLSFQLTLRNASSDEASDRPVIAEAALSVATKRKWRLIDRVFECCVGFVACILALCMGCVTDCAELGPYFRRPLGLLICLVVQHALMPPVAFGLYHLFSLQPEIGFGLVATASMPGGGMAHLTVFLMSGDRKMSAAVSIMNCLLNLCLSPAWIVVFTCYFKFDVRYYRLVLWLLPLCASQSLGALLATCRSTWAQALLNWVGRPFLLLAAILMSTLGIYINHYAIDHMDAAVLGCVLCFIGCGFCLGGGVGYLTRQSKPRRKAMAAEAASCTCLLALPGLRYACPGAVGDLATIASLATAMLTPAPILLYLVSHKVKGWALAFIDKRREKQNRHYSIVNSLARMAEGVAAVSAPLALDEGHRPAATAEEKQKVTTL